MEQFVDPTFISREYDIPTSRLGLMDERIAKLNRKADKLGCPQAVVTVISEPFIIEVRLSEDNPPVKIEYVTVSVSGEAPKLDGWSYLGYIDQDKLVYGDHITDEERNRQGQCDYCKIDRSRTHTYVVSHENGDRQVVGSTCLKDFVGGKSPDSIVSWLRVFQKFMDSIEGVDYADDGGSHVYDLPDALELAWKAIRIYGWVSGKQAYQDYSISTAQIVKNVIDAPDYSSSLNSFKTDWARVQDERNLPDSDPQLVEASIEWAKSHKDSDNNYLNNIGIIAENGYTTKRSMGMAVSILSSYEREVEKRIKKEANQKLADGSEHLGEVGKRQVFDDVTLSSIQYIDGQFGTTVLHKFLQDGSNVMVWFGSKELDIDLGETVAIKATVKRHDEFNFVKQTIVNRVTTKI